MNNGTTFSTRSGQFKNPIQTVSFAEVNIGQRFTLPLSSDPTFSCVTMMRIPVCFEGDAPVNAVVLDSSEYDPQTIYAGRPALVKKDTKVIIVD